MSRIHNSVQHRKHSARKPNVCKEKQNWVAVHSFLTWLGIRQICRSIGYRNVLLLHLITFKSLASDQGYQISPLCSSYLLCQMSNIILTLSSTIPTDCGYISLSFLIFQKKKNAHTRSPKGHLGGIRYHPWLLLEAQRLWGTRFRCNISQGLYIGVHNGA